MSLVSVVAVSKVVILSFLCPFLGVRVRLKGQDNTWYTCVDVPYLKRGGKGAHYHIDHPNLGSNSS